MNVRKVPAADSCTAKVIEELFAPRLDKNVASEIVSPVLAAGIDEILGVGMFRCNPD